MRERDVAGAVEAQLRRVGFDTPPLIPSSHPGRTRLFRTTAAETAAEGDLVVLDFGGMFGGYVRLGRCANRR